MAIRSVIINVATNAASVGGSFQVLAAATREVAAANVEAAQAADLAVKAENELAAVNARAAATTEELDAAEAKLAATTDMAVAATEKEMAAQEAASEARLRAGKTIGMIGLALSGAMVYGFLKSVEAASAWQQKMTQVQIAGNLTASGMQYIGNSLLDLSVRMPLSANALADALAVIERQGYRGAQAMDILQQSGQAAVIGLGDVTTVARNVMAVMDAYSTQGVTAGQVTQLLTAAFLTGQGDIDGFAKSLAQVAPVAGLARVPIEGVVAAMQTMTKEGLNTQQAAMAINRFMLQIINPTSDLSIALRQVKDQFGNFRFESGAAALKAEGLGGVMSDLLNITHGNVAELERLYPSVRAFRGVAALAANDGKNFADALALMTDQTRLAAMEQDAYQKQQATFASQVTLAKNNIHQLSVEAGQTLLPTFNSLIKSVQGLFQWFQQLPGPVKTIAIAGGALAAVLVLLASAALILAPGFLAMAGAVTMGTGSIFEMTIAVGALEVELGPLLLVLLPIMAILGAVGFGIMEASKHAAEGRQAVKEYADAWESAAQGTAGAVQAHAQSALIAEGAAKSIRSLGLNIGQVTEVIARGRGDTKDFGDVVGQIAQKADLTADALKKQGYSQAEVNRIQKDVAGSVAGSKTAYDDLVQTTTLHTSVTGENNKAQEQGIKTLGDIRKERDRANQGLKEAREHEKDLAAAQADANREILTQGKVSAETNQRLSDLGITTDKLTDDEKAVQTAFKNWTDVSAVVTRAKDEITADMKGFEDASGVLSDVIQAGQQAAQKAAQDQAKAHNDGLADQNQALSQNVSDMTKSAKTGSTQMATIAQTNIHNAKYQASQVKDANKDLTESAKDVVTKYVPTMKDFVASLDKTAKDTADWRANLQKISDKGGAAVQPLVDALRKMGKDGVPLVKDFAGATAAEMKTASDSIKSLGDDTNVSFDQFSKGLQDQLKDMSEWQKNLVYLAENGADALSRKFVEMGPQSAKATKDAAAQVAAGLQKDGKIPQAVADINTQIMQTLDLGNADVAKAFNTMLSQLGPLAATGGQKAADDLVSNFVTSFHLPANQAQAVMQQLINDLAANGHADASLSVTIAAQNQGVLPQQYGSTNSLAGWGGSHRRGLMEGGIVHYYAEGHVAQIAPTGTTRVWNEPEAGGEAYIPLSPSKAGRSTAIWREVGRILGSRNDEGSVYPAGSAMVTGGPQFMPVYAPPPPPTEKVVSRTTEYNFTGPIQGYNLEMVQRDADRKARLSALGGGAGLGGRG
jgi:TP901 family phage tail tape measure protein